MVYCLDVPRVDWEQVATSLVTAVVVAWLTYFLSFFGVPSILRHARKEGQLLKVARFRTEGVAIRNRGRRVRGVAAEAWKPKAAQWEASAPLVVGEFSRVEGERIRTLDTTKRSGVRCIDREHDRLLRVLDATLARLDNLIERHSPAKF
jgi:hypothetical protein